MAQFRYRAINKEGFVKNGVLSCSSRHQLESMLANLNLELLSAKESRPLLGFARNRKISRRDIINYCFYLEQMTRSGIPIIEALEDLQESTAPSYLSEVISAQVTSIQEGKSFSESLAEYPNIFSGSFISLVKAGERSGELVHVLGDLTESLIWQDELIVQTKKALMMPGFMGFVVFMVVFFLMTFLVPQLVEFMTMMGEELPLNTRILIAISDFFVEYWYVVLLTPILIGVFCQQTLKHSTKARLYYDRYKLKLWMLGPISEKIILARFVNYLALLYNSGIPVIESIQITENVVDNKYIEAALIDIREMISEGASVGVAFQISNIFPKLILSMLNVGEKTGDLGTSLQNVSYFYKRDVNDAVDNMQRMIEPAMTVILGLIIGWVMMSVLGPVYNLISNVKM